MTDDVSLFIDLSNTYIAAQAAAVEREGQTHLLRLHFGNVVRLAAAGRKISSAVCVGSFARDPVGVREQLRQAGVLDVELFERGRESGKEQAVDQALQVRMLRALVERQPGVAVLLTGDGAGYTAGVGFHADLERLYRAGWGVEVLAWRSACNGRLRDWAKTVGAYVELDQYYESVTFVAWGRRSRPLSLRRRGMAYPHCVAS